MDQPSEMYTRQAKKGNKMKRAQPVVMAEVPVVSAVADAWKSCSLARPVPHLSKDVAIRLAELAPTVQSASRGERCMRELQSMMRWLGPTWQVRAFGSYANGFGTRWSDLDVTCCHLGQVLDKDDVQFQAAMDLQMWILPMIQQHSQFSIVEQILGARVPILKLRFENVLDVDLSCHNPKPLLNTRLLKAYSQMDSRIRDLGLVVKIWAKGSGICDAATSNLTSYAFSLLVIYFLQVHPDVQLPVLPVEAFEQHGKQSADPLVIAAMESWQCRLSLPEMMLRFFAFYSEKDSQAFRWGSEVVSVRCGCRRAAGDPSYAKLRGKHALRLHIEDPYELERNLHAVLGEAEEAQLRAAFCEAWLDMDSNRLPLSLQSTERVLAMHGVPAVIANPQQQPSQAKSNLADLVQKYKKEQVTGAESSAVSTKSSVTPQIMSSDDESGADSSGESSTGANS